MADVDYGQAEIAAFNAAAEAGTIEFDPAAVTEAVGLYDRMIAGLYQIRDRMRDAVFQTGFGGFESGLELQRGFCNKAADGINAINQLIEGAMRLQEAYLRAGNLISEADQRNADTLRFVAEAAEPGSPKA
ncbi:hypothetical protein NONI108955_23460 [Nocardia ninae]|uniref:Uncharacterized protein n=1 Tax=Nocardia ninae NBRC 108245 TaxID=1210091 RepID=A0A511MIJ3_9NOCA|nr:hypothetical protein [Nocardia ninae]GEM39918.1 hypothetical protein NN4_44370 [Nocardia ninae NBRC 108245]